MRIQRYSVQTYDSLATMPSLADLPTEILLIVLAQIDEPCMGRHGITIFNLSYVSSKFYSLIMDSFHCKCYQSLGSGGCGANIAAFRKAEAHVVWSLYARYLECCMLSDEDLMEVIQNRDTFKRVTSVNREIPKLRGKYQTPGNHLRVFSSLNEQFLQKSWSVIILLL